MSCVEGEGVRDAQTTCSRINLDLKHRLNKKTTPYSQSTSGLNQISYTA